MQKVHCRSCGHEFVAEVSEEELGELTCEACGSAALEVVQPREEEAEVPGLEKEGEESGAATAEGSGSEEESTVGTGPSGVTLSLRGEEEYIEVPARTCPNCGAAIPEDAVLCVNCGYDLRSGQVLAARRVSPLLTALAGLAIGLVIGGLAGYLAGRGRYAAVPVSALATVSAKVEPGAAAQATVSQTVPAESGAAESPQPPVLETPAVEEAQVATAGEQALSSQPTAEERSELRQRIERRLRAWMEKRYPPYEKDKEADLRLRSGIVYRGRYLGVKGDTAVIVKGGESIEVPLAELDVASRLRADMAYRSQYLQRAVSRYERRVSGGAQPSR